MSKIHIILGKNEASFSKNSKNYFFSPLNRALENVTNICYEVESEEGVIALLAYFLCKREKLNKEQIDFLESLDIGYLSSECNVGEEELEELQNLIKDSKEALFEVGKDLLYHKRFANIQALLHLLKESLTLQCNFALNNKRLSAIGEISENNGLIVYLQKDEKKKPLLEVSKQFALIGKIKEECEVEVAFFDKEIETIKADLKIRDDFKGNVGLLQGIEWGNKFCYQKISLKA